jgi:DNA polymerase (family 10)
VDNRTIAQFLLAEARSLADRRDNLYRVRAYRRAAVAVMGLDRPVAELLSETGVKGLRLRAGIGESLAATIAEFVAAGGVPAVTARAG